MTQVYCIKKILGIKDPNIHLEEIPVEFETIKQVKHIIVHGNLTYTPRCCVNCGVINHSIKTLSRMERRRPQSN